mmetsp:Transcript_39659/g.86571  ORF Transcript_39659/g.86571 Transcript_39659/m.86571 type:complete len:205 (-) Transcript_39659:715-1329(-)
MSRKTSALLQRQGRDCIIVLSHLTKNCRRVGTSLSSRAFSSRHRQRRSRSITPLCRLRAVHRFQRNIRVIPIHIRVRLLRLLGCLTSAWGPCVNAGVVEGTVRMTILVQGGQGRRRRWRRRGRSTEGGVCLRVNHLLRHCNIMIITTLRPVEDPVVIVRPVTDRGRRIGRGGGLRYWHVGQWPSFWRSRRRRGTGHERGLVVSR